MRPPSWPHDAPAGQDWAAAVLLLAHAVNGFWEQARCLAQRYVPAALQDIDACLPRREHPLRWRMRVMARVLRLLVRPSRAERFALADLALRVDGPNSRWRLSAPKL
jgi:hypothetical protein